MGCGSSVNGRAPTKVNKLSVSQEPFLLTQEERKTLRSSWESAIQQKPDLFHKTWVRAIRKSIRMNEIIALGKYCVRDLTKWPKLHAICGQVIVFFSKVIVEFDVDPEKVSQASMKLGRMHHKFSEFGFQPVHFDIWVLSLLQILETIKFDSPEEKSEALEIWDRFLKFVSQNMLVGYSGARKENEIENRRRQTSSVIELSNGLPIP